MNRDQTAHERLIPLLVEIVGAESYLELGTYMNDTISKVKCKQKYGVDNQSHYRGAVRDFAFFLMTTEFFIKEYAPNLGPFDFVFIDADHSAEAVQDDLDGIWPHVSEDGLVLLHDTNPETVADTEPGLCGDAWSAVENILAEYECVTLPYHPGLTIIRKRKQWGPVK